MNFNHASLLNLNNYFFPFITYEWQNFAKHSVNGNIKSMTTIANRHYFSPNETSQVKIVNKH